MGAVPATPNQPKYMGQNQPDTTNTNVLYETALKYVLSEANRNGRKITITIE